MCPTDTRASTRMRDPLHDAVAERFGVLPNFFRLVVDPPEITANLWGFALFGYLDNPLPSLFKERLFVYLSRFCDARYCIARHVGFLVGVGRPSGDRDCPPETVGDAVRLIRRPLPRGSALDPHLAFLGTGPSPLSALPASGTPGEEAIFACASHVFLQTVDAPRSLEALRHAVGEERLQHLLVFLAFVRTAHFWTKVHPELGLEDDVKQLFATHEALADCVLNQPEVPIVESTQVILDELQSIRREGLLRGEMERSAEADRKKSEFIAMLAHELRNPLAPIRNSLAIMRRTGQGGEDFEKAGAMLERQVDQMVRLVDDLLDINRISRGRIEVRKEPADLVAILGHAVETVRPQCDAKGIELIARLPSHAIVLQADPTRVAQVVGNLLHNACKFTPPGGRVELDCETPHPEEVEIRVRDTGIGIAADHLVDIFDLFSQVDRSLGRSQGGLGIGLTLVRALVELHGGTIEASSPGLRQGSLFVVRLPVPGAAERRAPPPPAGRAASGIVARRVLIVDDNRDAAESLAIVLQLGGHTTRIAHDGLRALEVMEEFQPEFVLLDLGMPTMNGYEVARRIRARSGDASAPTLLALTGWGQEEDRRRTAESGFHAHLVKPVDLDALAVLLEVGPGGS